MVNCLISSVTILSFLLTYKYAVMNIKLDGKDKRFCGNTG